MIQLDIKLAALCISSNEQVNTDPQNQICLSYLIILALYLILLYNYLTIGYKMWRTQLINQLDTYDKLLVYLAIIRLFNILLFPLQIDITASITFFIFIWSFLLCCIFIKLVFEYQSTVKKVIIVLLVLFLFYFIFFNLSNYHHIKTNKIDIKPQQSSSPSSQQQHNMNKIAIIFPIYYPILIFNVLIILMGIYQLWVLNKALYRNNYVSKTIKVQLKNRYSFIFLICISSLTSFFLISFPTILREALGAIFYFLLLDWLSLLLVYFLIPVRILRQNTLVADRGQDKEDSRNSYLIEVQLAQIPHRTN